MGTSAQECPDCRGSLDKIENGELIPTLDVLIRLAGVYSTTVSDLASGIIWCPSQLDHSGPAEYLVSENDLGRAA